VTTTGNRSKTRAWARDPRTAAVFGGPRGSVTLLGNVELSYDAKDRRSFLDALWDKTGGPEEGREPWMSHMNTEGRMTGPIKVEKYITFDPQKLVT
jgi:hypothetical protein